MTKSAVEPLTWDQLLKVKPYLIFGILNITPDSFSDGGYFIDEKSIGEHFNKLAKEGADIIDVGAESTRPGSQEIESEVEQARLDPLFSMLKSQPKQNCLLSIDTRHSSTARIAAQKGFQIINDISGASFDPEMAEVMAQTKSLVVIMHSRGTPETMNSLANYENVADEVTSEIGQYCENVIKAGVDKSRIMIDPGFGFAKTPEQGMELLKSLPKIKSDLGYPMMVGISRKTITSFILSGDAQKVPFEQRDDISAQVARSLRSEGIEAFRVHNVAKTIKSLESAE